MTKLFKFTLTLAFILSVELTAKGKYNILLFTADDLHSESLGSYGGKPEDLTPHLDKFASEGMKFERAHVNVAICYPCRSVIGTGLYSHNSGAMGFMPTYDHIPNVIDIMKEGGYLTGILGKQGHSTPKLSSKWDFAVDQDNLGDGRSPSLYKKRADDFFAKCKDEDKPFYFMVNSHDPHRPFCYSDKLREGAEMPSKIYTEKDVLLPGFLPDLKNVKKEYAAYLNSTRRLDDCFGAVMESLANAGFAENTLVMFMSDNGIAMPFAKCNTWFYSTRTPLLVRLPKQIKAGSKDLKNFVSTIDFLPTFLELTGVEGPRNLDGQSFLPLLRGETQKNRAYVYTQIDKKAGHKAVPMRAVQNERFIYIYNAFDKSIPYRNSNEGLTMKAMVKSAKNNEDIARRIEHFRHRVSEEFYDLQKDPDCLNNLVNKPEYKTELQKFKKKLAYHMIKVNDPILKAFQNIDNRKVVDEVLLKVYGKPENKQKKL